MSGTQPTTTKTPSPIPVTLNCSGGISLGAYMAGVIYELVKEARSDKPLIEIDVITGASAGAITGLIAAYYLLTPKGTLESATTNTFYKIWVEQSDISTLRQGLKLGGWFSKTDEDIEGVYRSIFTSEPIKKEAETLLQKHHLELTEEVLKKREDNDDPPKPLALIMTVTNLSGLLKNSKSHNNKAISYSETRRFLFSSQLRQNHTRLKRVWEKALLSAQASSAFPGAFLPVIDESTADNYNFDDCNDNYDAEFKQQSSKICINNNTTKKFKFAYTDGGVLDNLPIIEGITFLRDLLQKRTLKKDRQHTKDLEVFKKEWDQAQGRKALEQLRQHIYIQPNPYKSLEDSQDLREIYFSWLNIIGKGLKIPHLEHDHLRLEDIKSLNETYQFFEDLKKYCNDPTKVDEKNPYLKVNLAEIDPSLLFTAESLIPNISADLMTRMQLEKPPSCQEVLASDILNGFGGFFQKSYRKHDFLLGRLSALTWLQTTFSQELNSNQTKRLPIQEALESIETEILESPPKLTCKMKTQVIKLAIDSVPLFILELLQSNFHWVIKILFVITGIMPFILYIVLTGIFYISYPIIISILKLIESVKKRPLSK